MVKPAGLFLYPDALAGAAPFGEGTFLVVMYDLFSSATCNTTIPRPKGSYQPPQIVNRAGAHQITHSRRRQAEPKVCYL